MTVSGSQLKIHDPSNSKQGLFIVSLADSTEYPIELEENFPSKLRGDIPDDLPPGAYSLKIVNTKYSNTTALRLSLFRVSLSRYLYL